MNDRFRNSRTRVPSIVGRYHGRPGRAQRYLFAQERRAVIGSPANGQPIRSRHHRQPHPCRTDLDREEASSIWIRFGTRRRGNDPRPQAASARLCRPGSIFAFVRWASNEHGTGGFTHRHRARRRTRRPYTTVPFVEPGGDILLRVSGWPKVERVLQAIDAVEAIGVDPADAAPDHWRHVHNRLAGR